MLVVALAVALLAVGVTRLRDAPVDVLPEFTPPYVEIQTEALGLSAGEVEQLITVPLEADLLNGVAGLDTIRSKSVTGLSSIVLVFEPGTDVMTARALVQERMTQAHALPNVSRPPQMMQPLSSSSRVLMIGLSSKQLTPIERSVIARWTVRPRLMGVPGVANVAIWGQRERQLQVQVDPERLRDRDVTLNQVVATAGNAQIVSPLSFLEASTPGTGGFIETAQQRLQVRHVLDKLATPSELGKVPLEDSQGRLRLTDVARVVEDHQPLIGDAVVNDGDGLLLVVEKLPGANTLEVTEGVEDALETLGPGLSGMEVDPSVFRPATFLEDAIDNLSLALVVAGALLVVVLAALLLDWRSVLIGLVTIPLALVAAALVLDLRGQTMNAIAFAGLAGALVVVIDDVMAGVDNVARRLRERGSRAGDASLADTVAEATLEVRRPIGYATLVGLLALVPAVLMEGRPGAFVGPLVLSYALAVLASLAVALTVAPALGMLLLARGSVGGRESPLLRRLAARYARVLAQVLRAPRVTLAVVGGCAGVGLVAAALVATSPIPSFKDRDVVVRLESANGTSQPQMTRLVAQASRELRSIPGVENVGAHVGRAVTGDQVVDVNSGDLWVRISSDADYEAVMSSVEAAVGRFRGVEQEVLASSEQEIRHVGALDDGHNEVDGNGVDVLTGADRPLVVRVFGQDPEVLRREAERVRQMVARVDGVLDPRADLPAMQQSLEIEVDLARAQRYGIKPGDVRRAESTLLQGIQVGSIFEQQKVFDVVVQGVPETRQSVESVRQLLLDRPGGGHVRLGDVADVRLTPTATTIERDAVSRYVDVEADVTGRSVESVAGAVEASLADMSLPIEYHAEVLRASTGEEIGAGRMLGFGVGAAIAVLLLLQAAFRSWRLGVLTLVTLPVALVGGVLGALVDGAELSLGSMIGLLAVLALAARTALVLFARFQRLEQEEGEAFGARLVQRGASERLAPVVMSTAATAAVLAPFVIMGAEPGLELVHPMAVVVLGGLATTTLLSLFVLPALYLRFAGGPHPVPSETYEDGRVGPVAGNGGAPGAEVVPSAAGDGAPVVEVRSAAGDATPAPNGGRPAGRRFRPEGG